MIHQYAYFALFSRQMPAAEMTARLMVEPDEAVTRGSRSQIPTRPVSHVWRVACRAAGVTVDEQIARLVSRLEPHAAAIGALAAELELAEGEHGGARMQIVRYFDHPQGEDEIITQTEDGLIKLAGQHQLLGWHLDRKTLRFLQVTHANLDIDEYN
jgi:hypothetical protein